MDVFLVVFSVSFEVCGCRPVRCGGCVATGACPACCGGSPLSWPPVVGSSGVVQWPVWACPAAFGRCRLSPTSFVSRQVCFVVVSPVAVCPCVRLLCCCQHFVWFAVVLAAQWLACPAVGCVGPSWPCRVGSGCSSCVGPAWYVLTVRRPLMVGRVLAGRKVATIGTTAEKNFEIRYDMPCPALEAALHAQPIIWHFAVPFGCPFSFACADHMYSPVGGKAPLVLLGAFPWSLWEHQGAAPAPWCRASAFIRYRCHNFSTKKCDHRPHWLITFLGQEM